MTSIPILEKNIHQTMDWIYAIEAENAWEDDNHKRTFAVLRIVLQELRDLLPIENAIHLSAQLPLIIRGLFFENWSTHSEQLKLRRKEDFLISVAASLCSYPDLDIEAAVRSVLKTLRRKISEGEIEKLIVVIPTHIRELFVYRKD